MNLISLENKKIYFAPKNDISFELSDYLSKNITFTNLGYLDRVNNIEEIDYIEELDYIIISSPNYYKEISDTLSRFVSNRKIHFSFFNKEKHLDLYSYRWAYNLRLWSNDFVYKLRNINYLKLIKYKNIHKNKRAFILGNGPSLNIRDLSSLQNEITFAANKIYLAYEDTQWRPTYYFVEDHLVYKQNFNEIKKQKEISFFPLDTLAWGRLDKGIYYDFIFENYSPNLPKISSSAIKGLYWGGTVVYSMLQMAIYMGIKEVYIIGLDFSFDVPKKDLNSKEHIRSEGEVNHFHKDYRKVGEKWTQPKLDIQELAFRKVKEYCKSNNIKIYNASRSTKLEIIDLIDFDDLFIKKKDI
ncbi:MAG: hypothetical protein C0625_09550 [Arcobacter sp.]|nr:MAG: hypothetical protein C0625_09550 [Arcobacter sp.]